LARSRGRRTAATTTDLHGDAPERLQGLLEPGASKGARRVLRGRRRSNAPPLPDWLPYLPDVNAYARAWDRIRAQAVREVAPALYATVNLSGARADDELDEYLRAYYGQPLDVMRYVQAIRGGSVAECLDWLARYVEAGARHLILRIGSLTAGPESVAEQLLPALKEIG
jgi:alkanesulfonate monooxygenase SsuD/methylene tetrahydromethanopterin reductase-like flavin-dependent oxidoreductase (luciferase family)